MLLYLLRRKIKQINLVTYLTFAGNALILSERCDMRVISTAILVRSFEIILVIATAFFDNQPSVGNLFLTVERPGAHLDRVFALSVRSFRNRSFAAFSRVGLDSATFDFQIVGIASAHGAIVEADRYEERMEPAAGRVGHTVKNAFFVAL